MRTVYVAGTFNENNIGKGMKAKTDLFEKGFLSFVPRSDYHFCLTSNKKSTIKDFYDYSTARMAKCDYMVVLPDSESPKGEQFYLDKGFFLLEIEEAQKHNIPIFYGLDEFYKFNDLAKSWKIKYGLSEKSASISIYEKEKWVCDVMGEHETGEFPTDREAIANSYLIESAPQLLDICKKTKHILELVWGVSSKTKIKKVQDHYNDLNEIINKAENKFSQ